MHLTVKQIALMKTIGQKNEDGTALDLDQIIERLSYTTTKASLQFSLRALIKHGLIEKLGKEVRRGRAHQLIGVTEAGQPYAKMPGWGALVVVDEDLDALELDL